MVALLLESGARLQPGRCAILLDGAVCRSTAQIAQSAVTDLVALMPHRFPFGGAGAQRSSMATRTASAMARSMLVVPTKGR